MYAEEPIVRRNEAIDTLANFLSRSHPWTACLAGIS